MFSCAGDVHVRVEVNTVSGIPTPASTHSQAKSMLHKPDIPSRIAITIICLMVIIVLTALA